MTVITKPIKPVILFVGNYNRKDYLTLFQDCLPYISFRFLYFSSNKEETDVTYKKYGKAIYWKDFTDAYQLINSIKPSKVIFFEIDTYNQVALNVASKSLKIKTYLLDHGVRHPSFTLTFEQTEVKNNLIYQLATKVHPKISLINRIRTRLFFLNSVRRTKQPLKNLLKTYFKVRSKNTIYATKRMLTSPALLPDVYLSFSTFVYEAHQAYDAPPSTQEVYFIGIPYLDRLVSSTPVLGSERSILFIDQAFVTQKILGWTPENKLKYNIDLVTLCEKLGFTLYVKEHPMEQRSMWNHVKSNNLIIDNTSPIEELASKAQIVIGFYSTLLLGLAALPHTTVLTFEGHPAGDFSLSDFLTSRGVSDPFQKLEELYTILPESKNIQKRQANFKAEFIEECLYRFDGKSGERLKNYLVN